jgi:hypothetical protein
MHSQALLFAALVGIASSARIAARATTNTNLQTAFPASSGTTNLAAARTLAAGETVDGGMKQWDRSRMHPSAHLPGPTHVSALI